ncbi:retrovirus-related pol polyprotein from transposon TNT 1-94 [Tanacetum coccineum]
MLSLIAYNSLFNIKNPFLLFWDSILVLESLVIEKIFFISSLEAGRSYQVASKPLFWLKAPRHQPTQKNTIELMVKELLDSGVIRHSQSSFASPRFTLVLFDDILLYSPVMEIYGTEDTFVVETDASGLGIGAILQHNGHLIAFMSPYTPTIVTTPAVPATENSLAVPEQTTVETVMNMTLENRAHFESKKEVIHLILTGIGDEIYSTVDACQTAQEMWEAIERLQQGESLNIQDVKTNLFWEFGQFTSHDGETIESYYTRFYKMMNEMIRNNLTVATMQVNVQFLQQLQPEWSRFVTIVKQQHKLDEVSYHKLFDILKQYQKEVNELRAERMAKNANPLALVATAQTLQDPYYQTSKPHKSYAPTSKASLPTRSHATTRYKGKEIAKPITPPSESASEEDSDPEQAQRDKDMQKNLALIAKYFKKLYKPTNNNLRTSSNTRNKNVDTTPRYKNDNQTGQFGNQRAVNVVGARETVGGPVVQQSGIQCFNCKEFGHYAKECRKPKRVKDSTYHKEKMLLCKQAEKGVQLQAEQSDWLADTDEEIDEQELEAHYSYIHVFVLR